MQRIQDIQDEKFKKLLNNYVEAVIEYEFNDGWEVDTLRDDLEILAMAEGELVEYMNRRTKQ